MNNKTREALKAIFDNGKKPTGQDFAALLDSSPNFANDGINLINRGVNSEDKLLQIRSLNANGKLLELGGKLTDQTNDPNEHWLISEQKADGTQGLDISIQGNSRLFIDKNSGSVKLEHLIADRAVLSVPSYRPTGDDLEEQQLEFYKEEETGLLKAIYRDSNGDIKDIYSSGYTDHNARVAIATTDFAVVGVNDELLDDHSLNFFKDHQLNLAYLSYKDCLGIKYRFNENDMRTKYLANQYDNVSFQTLGIGNNLNLDPNSEPYHSNAAKFEVNFSPMLPNGRYPNFIKKLNNEDGSSDFVAASVITANTPNYDSETQTLQAGESALILARSADIGRIWPMPLAIPNFARFDVSCWEMDYQNNIAKTQLDFRLSIGTDMDGNMTDSHTPYIMSMRSDGSVGFSEQAPIGLVHIGGGVNSTDGQGAKNQLVFSQHDGGFCHFLQSGHSDTQASGNYLTLWLNTANSANGSSQPTIGNNWVWRADNTALTLNVPLQVNVDQTHDIGSSDKRFATAYCSGGVLTTSDTALKHDISEDILGSMAKKYASALDFLTDIKVIRYKLNEQDYDRVGFDARELYAKRFPGSHAEKMAVHRGKSHKLAFGEYEALSNKEKQEVRFFRNDGDITAFNTAAIQELKKQTDQINTTLATIKQSLADIVMRIDVQKQK